MGAADFTWPENYQAGISLSYDDGLSCHHQSVAPELEAHGFRGTFYVPAHSTLLTETEAWKHLAAQGHELGNHSCFHPCRKEVGMDWVHDQYNLKIYSEDRWLAEMRVASLALSLIDGKDPKQRSFGNTCNHTIIGPDEDPISLDNCIEELFVAGRGEHHDDNINVYESINFSNLGNTVLDKHDFDGFKSHIDKCLEQKRWLIIEMHGIGKGTHNLFVESDVHTQVLDYLQSLKQIWVAPVVEIANYVKAQHA